MKPIQTAIMLLVLSSSGYAENSLGTREVLLDNQSVEVVQLTYPAGSESGIHTHEYANRVAYFVQGGTLELVPGDPAEPSQVLEFKAGDALYLPATTHNVKNVGATEVVIIETEIK